MSETAKILVLEQYMPQQSLYDKSYAVWGADSRRAIGLAVRAILIERGWITCSKPAVLHPRSMNIACTANPIAQRESAPQTA